MRISLKNVSKDFYKSMDQEKVRIYRAAQGALRKIGFDLKTDLQKDIRAGKAGGHHFRALKKIRQRMRAGKGGSLNQKPLARLAHGVRYHVAAYSNKLHLQAGFVGPTTGSEAKALIDEMGYGVTPRGMTSKSWVKIAKRQQEGFQEPAHPELRKYFVRWATQSKDRKFRADGKLQKEDKSFFFIRKSTTYLETKPRLIIEPWWAARKGEVLNALPRYFEAKMRGKRL